MWSTMATENGMNKIRVVAKDADDDLDISRCFVQKNETKRAEIASAVDLRRPKTQWRHDNLENKWWTLAEEQEEKYDSVAPKETDDTSGITRGFGKRMRQNERVLRRIHLRRPKTRWRRRNDSELLGTQGERQNKKKSSTVIKLAGSALIKPRTCDN